MYDPSKIEPKWQKYWADNKTFKAEVNKKKEKHYVLDMFPYPSGVGLHVGHPEGYTATDIICRYKRMKGFNVLHPMGWDAFGLPAENYAIKTKVHPQKTTNKSIEIFSDQIKRIGFSYDWDRELNTSAPDYYKWTQWFFLFLYKNGLAYKDEAPVNWCESCKTVLAHEQVINGKCERCDNEVIQKKLVQWFFKITDFIEDSGKTDGLLTGLDKIDWPHGTLAAQKNWIGKKEGININYEVEGLDEKVTCFTTTPVNWGATFIVVAPEYLLLNKLTKSEYQKEVDEYVEEVKSKTELDRISEGTEKTGIFTGSYAINHVNGKKIPIWVSDFVLVTVGTGAVQGCPGHDMRDFEFAKKYDIPIPRVVVGEDGDKSDFVDRPEQVVERGMKGTMINSDFLDGVDFVEAMQKTMDHFEEKGWGKRVIDYKLRDWLVSRQRYWGAPIPILFCEDCGEVPVPEEDLPVLLPEDVDFMPTGESPLNSSKSFHEVSCPKCQKPARREVDTMDTFVCSSWYYYRFCDSKSDKEFTTKEALKNWCPVDLYVGGAEHTVLHLLYSRFFTKALHRHGHIEFDEPFTKLRHQGIILGEDGEKMSKSRGNVINPDDVIKRYGADTLRLYEMFMGPFEAMKPWSTKNIEGVFRFLQKAWRIAEEKEVVNEKPSDETNKLLHKTIKKVGEDIENFRFNTAISQMMILSNELFKQKTVSKMVMESFVLILAPFAPHLAEEIWEKLGHKETLSYENWPEYHPDLVKDDDFELVFMVNGKKRGSAQVPVDISEEEAIKKAIEDESVKRHMEGKEVGKKLYVQGKLVNVVVK